MRGKVEKETPKKEMDLDMLYDVTYETFQDFTYIGIIINQVQ